MDYFSISEKLPSLLHRLWSKSLAYQLSLEICIITRNLKAVSQVLQQLVRLDATMTLPPVHGCMFLGFPAQTYITAASDATVHSLSYLTSCMPQEIILCMVKAPPPGIDAELLILQLQLINYSYHRMIGWIARDNELGLIRGAYSNNIIVICPLFHSTHLLSLIAISSVMHGVPQLTVACYDF